MEQELQKVIIERDLLNKIPLKLRTRLEIIKLSELRSCVEKIRARIKSIKNKEIYYKPENIKKRKISNWKHNGICSRNWDKLYNVFTNTNKCDHCKITIVNYNLKMTPDTKVLHHDHDTGNPIAIVCNLCNIKEGEFLKEKYNFSIRQNENIY